MIYTEITTFLSDLTLLQAIPMLLACTMCIVAICTMITYISIRLADSVKDQNKELLDNMDRLFNNNPKNKPNKNK